MTRQLLLDFFTLKNPAFPSEDEVAMHEGDILGAFDLLTPTINSSVLHGSVLWKYEKGSLLDGHRTCYSGRGG